MQTEVTELKEKFEVELKTAFENFEKFVTANGDTGYFVGDKVSKLAHLLLCCLIIIIKYFNT